MYDQLNQVFSSDTALPDSLVLVNTSEWQGQVFSIHSFISFFSIVPHFSTPCGHIYLHMCVNVCLYVCVLW